MNTPSPSSLAAASADNVLQFMHTLHGLLDEGASSDAVWNHCIENATRAKRDLAAVLNHYQKRTGQDELSTS